MFKPNKSLWQIFFLVTDENVLPPKKCWNILSKLVSSTLSIQCTLYLLGISRLFLCFYLGIVAYYIVINVQHCISVVLYLLANYLFAMLDELYSHEFNFSSLWQVMVWQYICVSSSAHTSELVRLEWPRIVEDPPTPVLIHNFACTPIYAG